MTRRQIQPVFGVPGRLVLVLALAPWVSACAARGPEAAPAAAPTEAETAGSAPAGATFEAQVARGQELYGEHCGGCHGADGTGGSAAAVVGPGVLQRFSNAAEVFAFASEKMPGNAPGSLSDEDMLSILAFDLHANGVDLPEPLGRANAEGILLGAK